MAAPQVAGKDLTGLTDLTGQGKMGCAEGSKPLRRRHLKYHTLCWYPMQRFSSVAEDFPPPKPTHMFSCRRWGLRLRASLITLLAID